MTEEKGDRSSEYRKLIELCERYQLGTYAKELQEGVNLEEVRERIGTSLRANVALYYQNKEIYDETLRVFLEQIEQDYLQMRDRLLNFMDGQYYELGRDQALTALWLKCGTNLTVYGELFSYQIKESGVKDYCETILKDFRSRLRRLVRRTIRELHWHQTQVADVEPVESVQWGDEDYTREGADVYLADDFLFRLLQTANSYGFGNAIKLLSGAELLQKAIEIGQKALMWYLDSCTEQCNRHLEELRTYYRDTFVESLLAAFSEQTGMTPEEITDQIWEMEYDLTQEGLYEDVGYYPILRSGRLVFLQSVYYRKTPAAEVSPSAEQVCEWAKSIIFEPFYAERTGDAKSQMYGKFFSYNGAKQVRMPIIRQGSDRFEDNREFIRFCPFFDQIEWGEFRDPVQEIYRSERQRFQEWCVRYWVELCEEREQEIVRQSVRWFQGIFEAELASFIREWNQKRQEINVNLSRSQIASQEYVAQMTVRQDYFAYYQWYYYPVHPTEHTVRFLMEYRQRNLISGYLLQQINYVDTKGESLRPVIADQIRLLFDSYLRQLEDERVRGMI